MNFPLIFPEIFIRLRSIKANILIGRNQISLQISKPGWVGSGLGLAGSSDEKTVIAELRFSRSIETYPFVLQLLAECKLLKS